MRLLTTVTALTLWASAALGETVTTPPFIEAVHPMNGDVLGVARDARRIIVSSCTGV